MGLTCLKSEGINMKIAIGGASGFIGSALTDFLKAKGHTLVLLKRGTDYDPIKGKVSLKRLQDVDALINLAGESIAQRWSSSAKEKIKKSRIGTTRLFSRALAELEHPPRIFINASAIGYYGNRGDEALTEESGKGEGFLADVVDEWEKALEPASRRGIRVVSLRFGIILDREGGALARMITPFKWGLGGNLGSGRQYMSWIAIDDALGAILHIINNETIKGPVNVVSPRAIRNSEFTKVLSGILNRPAFFHVPAFVIRGLLGEMGEELLLSSTKVEPRKLLDTKYSFLYPSLEMALKHGLGG